MEEEIDGLLLYFEEGRTPREIMTQIERQKAIYHYYISKERNLVKAQSRLVYSALLDPETFWKESIEIIRTQG